MQHAKVSAFATAIALLIPIAVLGQNTKHSIKLSWTYTQGSDPAVGLNVYQGTASGGPYTKQNTTPLDPAAPSYSDTTATGGRTYYYILTAVDAAGTESTNSEEASATILQIGHPTPDIGNDDPSRSLHGPPHRKRTINPPVK